MNKHFLENEASVLKATEKFKILTSDKYCKSSKYLKRGDILCTPEGISGHTVIVLSDGEGVVKENKKPETKTNKHPERKQPPSTVFGHAAR